MTRRQARKILAEWTRFSLDERPVAPYTRDQLGRAIKRTGHSRETGKHARPWKFRRGQPSPVEPPDAR